MTNLELAMDALRRGLNRKTALVDGSAEPGRFARAMGALEGEAENALHHLVRLQETLSKIVENAADHDTGSDPLNEMLAELQPLIHVKQEVPSDER